MIKAEEIRRINKKQFKYMTRDKSNKICCWEKEPHTSSFWDWWITDEGDCFDIGKIDVEEFVGKDWQECLIEFEPDYSDMIGCVGWFYDNADNDKLVCCGLLLAVDKEYPEHKFYMKGGQSYRNFRPAKVKELKFYRGIDDE